MSRLLHTVANATPVQTTTATLTNVLTWTPASHSPVVNNCMVWARGLILGKSSTNTGFAMEVGSLFKVISGTVTQVGTQYSFLSAGDMTATTSTLTTFGNIIDLNVNGIAAQTVNWTGRLMLFTSEL